DIRVTRAEFEARIAPRVRESLDELRATVERAGLGFGDLAEVFLTGGSSRIPLISDLFAAEFGRMPSVEGDPKSVVVLGALRAYQAVMDLGAAPDFTPAPDAPSVDS